MAWQKDTKAWSRWLCFAIQLSFKIFFADKLLSKWEVPYVIEEVYRSAAIKINNFEGTNPKVVNGQRIKHYISGNPINVETNVIETVTPEEYIKDTFRNISDSEKEYVCGTVSKPTPECFQWQFFSVLEYLKN